MQRREDRVAVITGEAQQVQEVIAGGCDEWWYWKLDIHGYTLQKMQKDVVPCYKVSDFNKIERFQ